MDQLSSAYYICYAIGICVLFVTGTILQILNLYSLCHRDNRQKELTPYLLSIAFANIVFLVSSYPSTFLSALSYRWIFGEWFCIAEGFLAGTSAIAMLCLLSVIVVKTSNAITKVSQVNRISPRYRSYKKDIALVWLFSIGVMLPPLLGMTTMSLEGGGTNCAPNWRPTNIRDITYAITLTLIAFVIPVIISMVFLTKIYRSLSRHREVCKKSNLAGKSRHIIDYGSVSKMVGTSIFIYVLLWTPYSVGVLVSVLSGNDRLLDGDLSLLPTLIAKSSAIFSPVVYFTFNLRFRRIVLKLFRCKMRTASSRVIPLTKTISETTIIKTTCDSFPEEIQVKPLESLVTKGIPNLKNIEEEEEVSFASSTISRYTERRGALKTPWI